MIEVFSNELGAIKMNNEDMEDGVWDLVAIVDHYIPYRNTFVKYTKKSSGQHNSSSDQDNNSICEESSTPHSLTIRFVQSSLNDDPPKNDKNIPTG